MFLQEERLHNFSFYNIIELAREFIWLLISEVFILNFQYSMEYLLIICLLILIKIE